MPDLIVLLNHELSAWQQKQLREKEIKNIILPPPAIREFWQRVPPKGPMPTSRLNTISNWIKKTGKPNDWVLVQGEFGATFYIVDYCLKNRFIPVYATSEREYREEPQADGSITRIHRFRHIQFRTYERST